MAGPIYLGASTRLGITQKTPRDLFDEAQDEQRKKMPRRAGVQAAVAAAREPRQPTPLAPETAARTVAQTDLATMKLYQGMGTEQAEQLRASEAFQRQGGVAEAVSRLTPQQVRELRTRGDAMKRQSVTQARAQREMALEAMREGDTGAATAVARWLGAEGVEGAGTRERTIGVAGPGRPARKVSETMFKVSFAGGVDPATGRKRAGRTALLTLDQIAEQARRQTDVAFSKAMREWNPIPDLVAQMAPQRPDVAPPAQEIRWYPDHGFGVNKGTGQMVMMTPEQVKHIAETKRLIGGKGKEDHVLRTVGDALHVISLDPQTGAATSREVVGAGPQYKLERRKETQADGSEIERTFAVNMRDPAAAPTEIVELRSTKEAKALEKKLAGETVLEDGSPAKVFMVPRRDPQTNTTVYDIRVEKIEGAAKKPVAGPRTKVRPMTITVPDRAGNPVRKPGLEITEYDANGSVTSMRVVQTDGATVMNWPAAEAVTRQPTVPPETPTVPGAAPPVPPGTAPLTLTGTPAAPTVPAPTAAPPDAAPPVPVAPAPPLPVSTATATVPAPSPAPLPAMPPGVPSMGGMAPTVTTQDLGVASVAGADAAAALERQIATSTAEATRLEAQAAPLEAQYAALMQAQRTEEASAVAAQAAHFRELARGWRNAAAQAQQQRGGAPPPTAPGAPMAEEPYAAQVQRRRDVAMQQAESIRAKSAQWGVEARRLSQQGDYAGADRATAQARQHADAADQLAAEANRLHQELAAFEGIAATVGPPVQGSPGERLPSGLLAASREEVLAIIARVGQNRDQVEAELNRMGKSAKYQVRG